MLVVVPATAALADEPGEDVPDAQPTAPEVQLPAADQVDQVGPGEPTPTDGPVPTLAPTGEPTPTPTEGAAPTDGESPPAAADSVPLAAAPPLVDGYYGQRKVYPLVTAADETPAPDLTSTVTFTVSDGEGEPEASTYDMESDGTFFAGAFGQATGSSSPLR